MMMGNVSKMLSLMLAVFGWGASAPAMAQNASTAAMCRQVNPAPESLPGATTFKYSNPSRPMHMHILTPPNSSKKLRPAIMLFFGGGFVSGTPATLLREAEAFRSKGYVVALPDYRVFCRDGTGPAEAATDGQDAYRWMHSNARKLGIDRKRMVIGGTSAGGAVAASVAQRVPAKMAPAAMVLFNPVLAPISRNTIPGLDLAAVEAVAPMNLPMSNLPPTIVFHGTADNVVPIQQSRDYCAKAQTERKTCQLVEYAGLNHSFHAIRRLVPALGIIPYDDTMERSFNFVAPFAQPEI